MPGAASIAGFILGAAGSLHCIGMCGPLSLALPVYHLSGAARFFALFLYQAGRIITYSVIGFLFGMAGRRIYISGYQQWLSLGLGTLLLLLAVLYFIQKRRMQPSFLNGFYRFVQKMVIRILRSPSGVFSFLLLGMANGLLPCGMVYIALASSLTFSQVGETVIFMTFFGAGTLPAMLFIGYATQIINPELRTTLKKMAPVFISLMGVLLILRGLNLGIPFLSPELPSSPGESVNCHP